MIDITPAAPRAANVPAAAPRQSRRRSRWLLLILLPALLGLLVFGRLYWLGFQARILQLQALVEQARAQEDQLRRQLEQEQQAFAEQRERIQGLEAAIQERVAALGSQREQWVDAGARLRQQEEQVQRALANLREQTGRDAQSWRAAEALYLVELAARRLTLEQDPDTARQALRAADGRLQETADSRWQPARERLAADLRALEEVKPLEVATLSARLIQLAQESATLPLRMLAEPSPATDPAEPAAAGLPWWDSLPLRGLVRIEHRPAGDADPHREDRQLARQGLRLQIEAARHALARGDQPLFQASLDSARDWLDGGFDGAHPAVQRLRAALAELKETRLRPQWPDLAATRDLLRDLLPGEVQR